jgi:ornithine carbamoyltransferase
MSRAKPTAAFMHPLPANRGKEVSGDMLDSDNSLVFQQAENRLHMNKAIMLSLLETRTKNE